MRYLHLLFFLFLFMPRLAHALEVKDVRFGVHPDKTRLVVELDGTSDFRVFSLADPYRMVIDLPSFIWKANDIETMTKAGITGVRHGNLQPGISRVVFDMSGPTVIRSAFVLPANDSKPHRLVVDFNQSSQGEFEQAKNTIHGTLTTDNTPSYAYKNASVTGMTPPIPQKKSKKPIVVIDPGHGGVDPGAIAKTGVYEKNITLKLAKALRDALEATGNYTVYLTRETDIFIPLRERVAIARNHNADLFVSVHADSIQKRNVSGASIYTLSEKASDAQTARLADRENRADSIAGLDLSVEDDEVANILVDLAMRDTMNQSKFFANTLVDTFSVKGVKTLESAHRYAGFAVLKAPDIPSVLVEAGFLSNSSEAKLLNSASYRQKIADALRKGIDAYFEQARKNQRI